MQLRGEDLSCYLYNIRPVGLWKCLYDHELANKAYFSDIIMKNIYQSFTHKMAAKANWHWNYVTVTLCILEIFLLCYGVSFPHRLKINKSFAPITEPCFLAATNVKYDLLLKMALGFHKAA